MLDRLNGKGVESGGPSGATATARVRAHPLLNGSGHRRGSPRRTAAQLRRVRVPRSWHRATPTTSTTVHASSATGLGIGQGPAPPARPPRRCQLVPRFDAAAASISPWCVVSGHATSPAVATSRRRPPVHRRHDDHDARPTRAGAEVEAAPRSGVRQLRMSEPPQRSEERRPVDERAMKALVLAGGRAPACGPITHTSAKQLVPVANKPILFYGLERSPRRASPRSASSSATPRDEIRGRGGRRLSAGASRSRTSSRRHPSGSRTACCIARDFLGDDDFVMYLGDNLLRQRLKEFVDHFEANRADAGRADPARPRARPPAVRRRRARTGDGEVCGWSRSRPTRRRTSPWSACTCSTPPCTTRSAPSSRRPEASSRSPRPSSGCIDHGHRVRHQVLEGYWNDTGQARRHCSRRTGSCSRRSNQRIDGTVDGDSRRSSAASWCRRARRSWPPRFAGRRSSARARAVEHSFVGPFTSIYYGCEIMRSEIEHSVVLEHSRIVDMSPHRGLAHRQAGRGRPLRARARPTGSCSATTRESTSPDFSRTVAKVRLFVTGAAGFIGANFVRYWVSGHPRDELVVYDLLTYAGNRENLAGLEDRLRFVQGDIGGPGRG